MASKETRQNRIEFVKANYKNMTIKQITEMLGISPSAVYKIKADMNLTVCRIPENKQEIIDFIKKNQNARNVEIGKRFKISEGTVRKYRKIFGIPKVKNDNGKDLAKP